MLANRIALLPNSRSERFMESKESLLDIQFRFPARLNRMNCMRGDSFNEK